MEGIALSMPGREASRGSDGALPSISVSGNYFRQLLYRAGRAHERAVGRRGRSRRNSQFGKAQLARVEALLREEWSPEEVAGYLRRRGEILISHETIYRHVWRDLKKGGSLHLHLRCAQKQCRKRHGRHDSRGRLAGKRSIAERPAAVEGRRQLGHWEAKSRSPPSTRPTSGSTEIPGAA